MKNFLIILIALFAGNLPAQDITGQWNGAIEIQGTQLRIVFNIEKNDTGLVATLDSPDQGAAGIATTSTTLEENQLTIVANALGMKYDGELSTDGTAINGTFNQGGMSLPLNLSRKVIEAKPAAKRPQDPTDFPYEQEAVKFKNPVGGHALAGTLTIPKNGAFDKVVILVSGSGPQNRDEEVKIFNHRPFLVLSDYLTRNGIAVLRYDDRGVGESEGNFQTATSKDFAADASAAVAYLASRSDMKGKKIGIAGHSEGGMIAPMVASENQDVAFIVLLAGPGIKIPELLLIQSEKIGRASGVSEATLKTNNLVSTAAYNYLSTTETTDKAVLRTELTSIFKKYINDFSAEELEEIGDQDIFIDSQIDVMLDDWFLYFLKFDPETYLSKVSCPVLAINGELDLQVTARENLASIEASLAKAKNTRVTIQEIPGLNHLFQKTETGAPSEYGQLEETFNEEAMAFVAQWIIGMNNE